MKVPLVEDQIPFPLDVNWGNLSIELGLTFMSNLAASSEIANHIKYFAKRIIFEWVNAMFSIKLPKQHNLLPSHA